MRLLQIAEDRYGPTGLSGDFHVVLSYQKSVWVRGERCRRLADARLWTYGFFARNLRLLDGRRSICSASIRKTGTASLLSKSKPRCYGPDARDCIDPTASITVCHKQQQAPHTRQSDHAKDRDDIAIRRFGLMWWA